MKTYPHYIRILPSELVMFCFLLLVVVCSKELFSDFLRRTLAAILIFIHSFPFPPKLLLSLQTLNSLRLSFSLDRSHFIILISFQLSPLDPSFLNFMSLLLIIVLYNKKNIIGDKGLKTKQTKQEKQTNYKQTNYPNLFFCYSLPFSQQETLGKCKKL